MNRQSIIRRTQISDKHPDTAGDLHGIKAWIAKNGQMKRMKQLRNNQQAADMRNWDCDG